MLPASDSRGWWGWWGPAVVGPAQDGEPPLSSPCSSLGAGVRWRNGRGAWGGMYKATWGNYWKKTGQEIRGRGTYFNDTSRYQSLPQIVVIG